MMQLITGAFNPTSPMAQMMVSQFIVSSILNFIPHIISQLWEIIKEFLLIILSIFHIHNYEISGELLKMIDEQIFKHTPAFMNDNQVGIVFGRWYIGYVSYISATKRIDTKILKLLTTKAMYDKMTKYRNYNVETKNITISQKKNYKLVEQITQGDYTCFTTRYIHCPNIPTTNQAKILRKIVNAYSTRNVKSLTSILHGIPGAGKSTVASLLACMFDGMLISNWKFNDASKNKITFENMYACNKVSNTNPLIVLIDEVDELLNHIIENTKNRITSVEDKVGVVTNKLLKSDWCNWLDRVDAGIYPFVLIIMTTNEPLNKFDDVDKAYLRKGRIHLKFNITETL